jgi:RNA polymerase sigma factor (sigma-70 family)
MEQQGGLSDAELVRGALGARTPDERKAAFTAIADRYRLTVFRQCARWFPHPAEAQDVGQTAFEAAFTLLAAGKGPERPDKLAGWLIEIARHRGQAYRRKDKPAGVSWAFLPEGQSLDEVEDDTEPSSGSAMRRAHVNRLVETVVSTLTARQQEVYQLRITAELTGREVAERLGITSKAASNEITHVQDLIATGFGALILLQEGRRFCPDLARIIETIPVAVGTAAFTTALRERIVRHFDNCSVCDDCPTCRDKRRELVGPYVPAIVPILFAADFHDRITELVDRITRPGTHAEPRDPGSAPPAAGAARAPDKDLAAARAGVLLAAGSHPRPPTGKRRRRPIRRRAAASAGIVVLVLAVVTIVLVNHASGTARRPVATTGVAQGAATAYVATGRTGGETVRTLDTATGALGQPVFTLPANSGVSSLAVAPDGKTLYVTSPSTVSNGAGMVTPVTIATGATGTPIRFGGGDGSEYGTVVTPDGQGIYVTGGNYGLFGNQSPGTVARISTVTGTAGPQLQVPHGAVAIAISPDGKTAYVTSSTFGSGPGEVTPIDTATNAIGTPVNVPGIPVAIAITPDGKTAYVGVEYSTSASARSAVVPVDIATGTAGTPIAVSAGITGVAMAPDGKTVYVTSSSASSQSGEVTPVNTATNAADPPIAVSDNVTAIAITGTASSTTSSPNPTDTAVQR